MTAFATMCATSSAIALLANRRGVVQQQQVSAEAMRDPAALAASSAELARIDAVIAALAHPNSQVYKDHSTP